MKRTENNIQTSSIQTKKSIEKQGENPIVKVFILGKMRDTPFSCARDITFFQQQGITFTNNILDSWDIFLTARLHRLAPFRLLFGNRKGYLAWTHEPHYDTTFKPIAPGYLGFPDAHIMNAYTGDIFVNNYTFPFSSDFYRNYWDGQLPSVSTDDFKGELNRKIVAVMGYRGNRRETSLMRNGKQIDLSYIRTHIALDGHRTGKVDIYGRNWPEGIAFEDSRAAGFDGFQDRKAQILSDYHFNLCFENTNIPYYCTEKIWDSIRYGCLPIYFGDGNNIYQDFPQESFIDYAELGSSDNLFRFVEQMSLEEYVRRMNLCIETYNRVHDKAQSEDQYALYLERVVDKIKNVAMSRKFARIALGS